jgi:transcriptional regulator with XRE-family HTH domain
MATKINKQAIGVLALLSANLTKLRAEQGKTQAQVATAIGVAQTTVSELEAGTRWPRAALFDALARYYAVSAADLVA